MDDNEPKVPRRKTMTFLSVQLLEELDRANFWTGEKNRSRSIERALRMYLDALSVTRFNGKVPPEIPQL